LIEIVERSRGFRMEWNGPQRFESAKAIFRKHADHGYSFTDCTSFVVMRELALTDALTTHRHFNPAGFKA
jgi:predicted nucleic acid-binding protein